jgi:hypothetical protein
VSLYLGFVCVGKYCGSRRTGGKGRRVVVVVVAVVVLVVMLVVVVIVVMKVVVVVALVKMGNASLQRVQRGPVGSGSGGRPRSAGSRLGPCGSSLCTYVEYHVFLRHFFPNTIQKLDSR